MTENTANVVKKINKKAREELEGLLLSECPDAGYVEEGGELVKKVTQSHIYSAIKILSKNNSIMGKFLLHLDDRIEEQNGYKDELKALREDFKKLCNDRIESCPVLPVIRGLQEELTEHLSDAEKAELVVETTSTLKEKWKKEGREEASFQLRKTLGWIGAVVAIVTVSMALISWIFEFWKFAPQ